MRFLRGRGELARQDDPSALGLLAQMFGDIRMKHADVANETLQETT